MTQDLCKEIQLRLKAPIIALEKIVARKYLPKVFAEAGLNELRGIKQLSKKLKGKCKN